MLLARKPTKPSGDAVLAVRPEWQFYSSTAKKDGDKTRPLDEHALATELERSYKHTTLRPLQSPQELLFDLDFKVQKSFQFSTQALSCISRLLGLGLSQTIFDIGGIDRPGSPKRPVDLELAARLFNDAVKLRFNAKLKGRQLVIDRQKGQIDGIVGSRYEMFHNLDLYEHSRKTLSGGPASVRFHEAIIVGRRIALRYRTCNPLFEVTHDRATGEPFFGGYHLGNSEVGDCSVRAAVVIIRQWCDNKALAEFTEGGRVKHIRSTQFERRLHRLLDHVQLKAGEATVLKKYVMRLLQRRLDLGKNEQHHAERSKFITKRLEKIGLSRALAKAVMDHTLAIGSYRADAVAAGSLSAGDLYERYAQRTEYDLFNALTAKAKSLSVEAQERVEQLAYQFLLGKHSLAPPKETLV